MNAAAWLGVFGLIFSLVLVVDAMAGGG